MKMYTKKSERRKKNNNNEMKHKITQISNVIRKKFMALKLGKDVQDEMLARLYKPIKDPLEKIVKNSKKITKVDTAEMGINTDIVVKPKPEVKFLPEVEVTPSPSMQYEDVEEEDDGDEIPVDNSALEEYLEQYPPLARYYIEKYFNDRDAIDKSYGIEYDSRLSRWTMGSADVNFEKDGYISIDNKYIYKGTQGLYELIFMKNSESYNEEDLKNYKNILLRTNVHKLDHDPNKRVRGNKYNKYINIIKPLVQDSPNVSGKGINMTFNDKPVEYVYWDNINELVDRLRLLWASKMAGNNSHENEIASIIEELKESGIIRNRYTQKLSQF